MVAKGSKVRQSEPKVAPKGHQRAPWDALGLSLGSLLDALGLTFGQQVDFRYFHMPQSTVCDACRADFRTKSAFATPAERIWIKKT